ncbi:MAG: VTT domain-containing protein [Oscillibacter sp.]
MKKRIGWYAATPLFLLLAAVALWPYRHALTAEAISSRSPESAVWAALFLWGLYAVKSLSFCFPLAALEAAGGLLFPYPAALCVNMVGVALVQILPYFLGRRSRGGLDALLEKYPRLKLLRTLPRGGDGLFVLLLRLAGASPGDLVSLYLGAAGVKFSVYLPAGLAGIFPRVAATTFLGASLWDPGSEQFWLSVGINAAVTVFSLAVWRTGRRPRK